MAGAGAAAVLGGAGLASASNILNGQNSWSNSVGNSVGDSWGSSSGQSSSYGESNAWSKARSNSQSSSYNYGDSWGESASQSEEGSNSWGNSRTYGREASALDIQNAAEANQVQRDLWQMQADYNAKQAQIDRDYQAHMSNTAYQRAVADLVAAGLNPILAAGNMGASTPMGAMATSGLGSAAKANAIAEQESYNESSSWGNSSSRSYNRSHEQGESQSSSKSWSKSKSKSRESSQSSNSSSQGSHNESHDSSNSRTKTQAASILDTVSQTAKDTVGAVKDLFNGGSAKKQMTNKEKVWGQSTGNKKNRNSKR